MKQTLILAINLIFFYAFYFASSGGINTSNDGGHYGLATAIYQDKSLEVEKYLDTYILRPDYAVRDSVIYSDRLPGTAFSLLPLLAYHDIAETIGYTPDMNVAIGLTHPKGSPDPSVLTAMLLPNICGAISMLILFLICYKVFRFSFVKSLITMWVCALCTLVHLESSHIFSHALSMMLVTLGVFLAIGDAPSGKWRKTLMIISAIYGFAIIVELQNALLFIPIFLYVVHKNVGGISQNFGAYLREGIKAGGIVGLFLLVLLAYNYVAFDDVMLKSNKYNPFFPEERSFISALSGDIWDGLDRLITSIGNSESYLDWSRGTNNSTTGIVNANPVFLFSILGFIPFYRKKKAECLMFFAMIFVAVMVAALHVTTLIRHISTIYVLLFFPFVFFLDWAAKLKEPYVRFVLMLVGAISAISLAKQLYITHHYWGKGDLAYFPYKPYLGAFFVYNLPLFAVVGFLLFRTYRANRSEGSTTVKENT